MSFALAIIAGVSVGVWGVLWDIRKELTRIADALEKRK